MKRTADNDMTTKRKIIISLIFMSILVATGWQVVREVRLRAYSSTAILGRSATDNPWQIVGNTSTGSVWYSDGTRWIDTQVPLEHVNTSLVDFNSHVSPGRFAFSVSQTTSNQPSFFSATGTIKNLTISRADTDATSDLVQFAEELSAGDIKLAYRSSLDNGATWTAWVDVLPVQSAGDSIIVNANGVRTVYAIGSTQTTRDAAMDAAMSAAQAVLSGYVYVTLPQGFIGTTDGYDFTDVDTRIEIDGKFAVISNRTNNVGQAFFRFHAPHSKLEDVNIISSATSGLNRGLVFAVTADFGIAKNISTYGCTRAFDVAAPDCTIDGLVMSGTRASSRWVNEGTGYLLNCYVANAANVSGMDHIFAHNGETPDGYLVMKDVIINFIDDPDPAFNTAGILNCNWLNLASHYLNDQDPRMKKLIIDGVKIFRPNPNHTMDRTHFKVSQCEQITITNCQQFTGPNLDPSLTDLDFIILSPDAQFDRSAEFACDELRISQNYAEGFIRGLPTGGVNPKVKSLILEQNTLNYKNILTRTVGFNNIDAETALITGNKFVDYNKATSSFIFFFDCIFDRAEYVGNTFSCEAALFARVFEDFNNTINFELTDFCQSGNIFTGTVVPNWSDIPDVHTLIAAKIPGTFDRFQHTGTQLPDPVAPFTVATTARSISTVPQVLGDQDFEGTTWQSIASGSDTYRIPVILDGTPALLSGSNITPGPAVNVTTPSQLYNGIPGNSAQLTTTQMATGLYESYIDLDIVTPIPVGQSKTLYLAQTRFTDAGSNKGTVTVEFLDTEHRYIVGYDITHLIPEVTQADLSFTINYDRPIAKVRFRQRHSQDHTQVRIGGFAFPSLLGEVFEIRDSTTHGIVGYVTRDRPSAIFNLPGGEIIRQDLTCPEVVNPADVVMQFADYADIPAFGDVLVGTRVSVVDDPTPGEEGMHVAVGAAVGELSTGWQALQ